MTEFISAMTAMNDQEDDDEVMVTKVTEGRRKMTDITSNLICLRDT